MKRLFWLIAAVLVALPLFAQDDGGGGGAFAGGGGTQVLTRIDATNPMDTVKPFLLKAANITLTSDQEKVLRPIVEASLQQMRDLAAKYPAPRGGQGRGGQGRGGGGGGGRRGGDQAQGGDQQNASIDLARLESGPAAAELQKINDDMMVKITAALKPDQQAAFKKYQNDQIRKAGGFGALKLTMEEGGAPFTADQEQQIKGYYDEDAQQRAQLQKEAQGRPDPAKIADLEKATMGKIVKLLTAAQRKALLDSRAKPQ
jgi:hypothetical protein